MAAVTAAMVKDLREMTGAGMMDCKKALGETQMAIWMKAVEYLKRKWSWPRLRRKLEELQQKVFARLYLKDDKTAAVVEVNSETDFVAKNADIQRIC